MNDPSFEPVEPVEYRRRPGFDFERVSSSSSAGFDFPRSSVSSSSGEPEIGPATGIVMDIPGK